MIRDIWTLNRLQVYQIKNKLMVAFGARPIGMSALLLAGLGFYYGYLYLAFLLMDFIYQQEVYGVLLASKLVQILLFIAIGMSLMSSLTTSIAHYFLARDLEFQFSLPVGFNAWMSHRFSQVFLQSNWMLLLFGGPLIWYFMYLSQVPLLAQVLAVMGFVVLCSFPVIMASWLCLLLVKIFPARRVHQVFLVLTVVLVSSLILVFRYLEPEKFIGPGGLDRFRGFADMVNFDSQQWNPAIWTYNLIVALSQSQWSQAWPQGIRLLVLFAFAFGLLIFTARRLYRTSWDRALQSLSGETDLVGPRAKTSWLSTRLSHFRWSQEVRELLLFLRDPSQWSQVFVLIALLGLYLFSLSKPPTNPFGGTRYALALGNTAFVAFICLSVSSRFVFTSFSADGHAIWLMKTAPDGWFNFIRSKLFVFGLPCLVFAQLLNVLSGVLLDLNGNELWLLGAASFWDASFMILLSLAMGMIFINPSVENPLKLIVSPGGLLLMASGLFFAGLHVALRLSAYSPLINGLFQRGIWPDMQSQYAWLWFCSLILVEGVLLAYLLKRGIRLLRHGHFS